MDNQNEIIAQLKDKISTIISLYEKEKIINTHILKEKEQLRKELSGQKKEFEDLKDQFNTLKLSKSLTVSSDNSHDAKIKMNSIVREIDKCIALLNR